MLLARLTDEPHRYFVFEPSFPGTHANPKPPREESKFTGSKKFQVRVTYSYGRQELQFTAEVKQTYSGLWYEVGGKRGRSGGSF
jgi:hypothetical protein